MKHVDLDMTFSFISLDCLLFTTIIFQQVKLQQSQFDHFQDHHLM